MVTLHSPTEVQCRVQMAAPVERCYIQGVPMAPHLPEKEGFQAIVFETLMQLFPQCGEGGPKPSEPLGPHPHQSCPGG